jgi:hypothetical protein
MRGPDSEFMVAQGSMIAFILSGWDVPEPIPVYLGVMNRGIAPDIEAFEDQLEAAERDAELLVSGLTEQQGIWRMEPASWSVSECLDHLASTNRIYVVAMQEAAMRARARGKMRRGPATPGWFGRWFAKSLEPPVNPRSRHKAPPNIRPRTAPGLADAFSAFAASNAEVRTFLRTQADLDLAGVTFPNPFIRGLRFSIASGLNNILAHERRHLWQAWRVRQAAVHAAG